MAKRYQRGNQKPKDRQHHNQKIPKGYSEDEGQTAPWPKETKGVIRRRMTDSTMAKIYQRCNQKAKDRQHHGQKIPKG